MYKVPDTFDELIKQQQGFLIQQARKIHSNVLYKHNNFDDIYQMVLVSGFSAWSYQKKQSVDGHAPYAFGTYFGNRIKSVLKQYEDLRLSNNIPVQDDVIDSTFHFEEHDDLIKHYTKGLSDLELKVFNLYYISQTEIDMIARQLEISSQYVRVILKTIAEKTKEKLC